MKLVVKGGRVIDPGTGVDGLMDLRIEDGTIVEVGENLKPDAAKVIDATGKVVIPGLIDVHTHLREPGYEWKETIATGTRAAAAGGFTAVCCMPNTNPVLDNPGQVTYVLEKARREGKVAVYPIGCITKGSRGEELTEIGYLREAGVVGLSDDGLPVENAEVMRCALEYARMFNLPVISHCEDRHLAGDGVMNWGPASTAAGLKGIPASAEEVMVARDLILAAATGGRLHLAHISTAGSVRLVREAKRRGVAVTCEVTPHHLTLTDRFIQESGYDTNTKVNPPLRTDADVAALREGLADGTIDIIATDHAPHHTDDKEVEYNYAAFGISGLDTALPLMVTELVGGGYLTLNQLVEKMCLNPARVFGLSRGRIETGGRADLTIIDPEERRTVDVSRFYSLGKNSPFLGRELTGWPVVTIAAGVVVHGEGK